MNEQKGCFGNIYLAFQQLWPTYYCLHAFILACQNLASNRHYFRQNLIYKILLPPIFLLYGTCMWITGAKCLCDQTFCLACMPRA